MKHLSMLAAVLVCVFAGTANAQDNRVFDWTPANGETIPMEPASLHAGRVYHPAAGGGNMHIGIESRYPVTIAMAWADEWNAAIQHPDAPANFSFLCLKEHGTNLIDQCYDKVVSLTDAVDQAGCKERGVQSMSFNCSFNVANGPQTLFILPDISFSGHKKAGVEVNTVKCVEHCDLLNLAVNP